LTSVNYYCINVKNLRFAKLTKIKDNYMIIYSKNYLKAAQDYLAHNAVKTDNFDAHIQDIADAMQRAREVLIAKAFPRMLQIDQEIENNENTIKALQIQPDGPFELREIPEDQATQLVNALVAENLALTQERVNLGNQIEQDDIKVLTCIFLAEKKIYLSEAHINHAFSEYLSLEDMNKNLANANLDNNNAIQIEQADIKKALEAAAEVNNQVINNNNNNNNAFVVPNDAVNNNVADEKELQVLEAIRLSLAEFVANNNNNNVVVNNANNNNAANNVINNNAAAANNNDDHELAEALRLSEQDENAVNALNRAEQLAIHETAQQSIDLNALMNSGDIDQETLDLILGLVNDNNNN